MPVSGRETAQLEGAVTGAAGAPARSGGRDGCGALPFGLDDELGWRRGVVTSRVGVTHLSAFLFHVWARDPGIPDLVRRSRTLMLVQARPAQARTMPAMCLLNGRGGERIRCWLR